MTNSSLQVGNQVKVGTVEGSTTRKGPKQNKVYTLTGINSFGHFYALDNKGNEFELWISTDGLLNIENRATERQRRSSTINFEVII